MKAFFSRKHETQSGQTKATSKDPFKLWSKHSELAPVQAGPTRSQATSSRTPKPADASDRPVPAPPKGAPTETTINRTTRTNTVPQPTYPHPSSSQLPPKAATTRTRDYDESKHHPPPRAATSFGFVTTPSQTQEERRKSSRTHLRNEEATIIRREVWFSPSNPASTKPRSNIEEKYRDRIVTEEPENYHGHNEKGLREPRREERQKLQRLRDREDRGFVSEREPDYDNRYRSREKERREFEAERMKELEREKERLRAKEREREREMTRERTWKFKEFEREREREKEQEQERQKEIEREKERERELRDAEERERQRERERQEMEMERERQKEMERQRERERERLRQERERQKEIEIEKERERLRQENEREKERERQKEKERQREQERERERFREHEKEKERQREEAYERERRRRHNIRDKYVEDYDGLRREHDFREQERDVKKDDLAKGYSLENGKTTKDRYQRERHQEHKVEGTDSEQETFKHRTSADRDRRRDGRSGRASDIYASWSSRQVPRETAMGDEDSDDDDDDFVILVPPPRQDLTSISKPSHPPPHHPLKSMNPTTGNSTQIQPNPVTPATLAAYTTPQIAPILLPSNETKIVEPTVQETRRGISRTKLENREDLDVAQLSSEPPKSLELPRRPPSRASQVQRTIYAVAPQSQSMHKQSISQSVGATGNVDGSKETLHTRARSDDTKIHIAPFERPVDAVFNAQSNSNHDPGRNRKAPTTSRDPPVDLSKDPQISNIRQSGHSRMLSDGKKETSAPLDRLSLGGVDLQSKQTTRLAPEEKESLPKSYLVKTAELQKSAISNVDGDIDSRPVQEQAPAFRPLTTLDSTGRPWAAILGRTSQTPASQTHLLPSLDRTNHSNDPPSNVQTAFATSVPFSRDPPVPQLVAALREEPNPVFIPSTPRQFMSSVVHTKTQNGSFPMGTSTGERSNAVPTAPIHSVPAPSNFHVNFLLSTASAETTAAVFSPLHSFAPPVRPHPPNGNYAAPISASFAEKSSHAQNMLSPGSIYHANENVDNPANTFSFEKTKNVVSSPSFTPLQVRSHPSNTNSATPFQTPPEVVVSIPEVNYRISQPQEVRQTPIVRDKADHVPSLSKNYKEESVTRTNEPLLLPNRLSKGNSGPSIEDNVISGHSIQRPPTQNHVFRPQDSGVLSPEGLGVRAEQSTVNSKADKRHLLPRAQYEEFESAKANRPSRIGHEVSSASVQVPSLLKEGSNQNSTTEQVIPLVNSSSAAAVKESSAHVPNSLLFDNIDDMTPREPVQHRTKPLSRLPTSDNPTQRDGTLGIYDPLPATHLMTHQQHVNALPEDKVVTSDKTAHSLTAEEHVGLTTVRSPRSGTINHNTSGLATPFITRNPLEILSQEQGHVGIPTLHSVPRRDSLLTSPLPNSEEVPTRRYTSSHEQIASLLPSSSVGKDYLSSPNYVDAGNVTPPHNRQGRTVQFSQATPAIVQRMLQDESPKLSSQQNGLRTQVANPSKDRFLNIDSRKASMEYPSVAHSVAPVAQDNGTDGAIIPLLASRNATSSSQTGLVPKQDTFLSNTLVANTPRVAHVTLPNTESSRKGLKHDSPTFRVQSKIQTPLVTHSETIRSPSETRGIDSGNMDWGNRFPVSEPQSAAKMHVVESVPQIKIRHLVTTPENKQEPHQMNGSRPSYHPPPEKGSLLTISSLVQQNVPPGVDVVKDTATTVNTTARGDKDDLQNRRRAKDFPEAKVQTVEHVPSANSGNILPNDTDRYNSKRYRLKKESPPTPKRVLVNIGDNNDDHGISRSVIPHILSQKKDDTDSLRFVRPSFQQFASVIDPAGPQKSVPASSQHNIHHPVLAELLSSPLKRSPNINQAPASHGDSDSIRRLANADTYPKRDSLVERPKQDVDQKYQYSTEETPPSGVRQYYAAIPPTQGQSTNTGVQIKDEPVSNAADTPLPRTAAVKVQTEEQISQPQITHRRNLPSSVPSQSVQSSRPTAHEVLVSNAKVVQASHQSIGATTVREARPLQSSSQHVQSHQQYSSSTRAPSTPFPNVQDLPRSSTPAGRPVQPTQSHVRQNTAYITDKPVVSLPRATASEETILMTPASLAPSLALKPTSSRQSNAESVNSQTKKKTGLLSRFRRTSAQPAQPTQKPEVLQPRPPSKAPDSSPEHAPLLEDKTTLQNSKVTSNVAQPVPISSVKDRNLDSRVFTPFIQLTSRKKKRSLSGASMEARDGEASTVMGSPTTSMHSTVPLPLPPIRDRRQATQEWLIKEEDHAQTRPRGRRDRPGVVIDAGEDAPELEDRERYGRLKRNPTKHRSSTRRQGTQDP